MSYIHSFPPVSGPGADRLILGSMPGKASLAANQYYAHPRIGVIFFNGAKAESVWRRHVGPTLPADLAAIPTSRLPSTSPANASIPYPVKLRQWRAVTTPL